MQRWWTAGARLVGVGLASALLLGACGSSGGGDDGAAGSATGARCEAVASLFLQRAGDPERAPEPVSDESVVRLVRQVAPHVPAGDRADLERFGRLVQASIDDPQVEPDDADVQAGIDVFDRLIPWAADTCPPADPVWGCASRATFAKVGAPIYEDGPPEGANADGSFDTPEGAATLGAEQPDAEQATLDRSARAAWVARVDADGLVRRLVEVQRAGQGWRSSSTAECGRGPAASEGQFEPVGEAIDGD